MKHLQLLLSLCFVTVLFLFTSTTATAQVQTPKYISMTPNTNGFYEYLPQGYDAGSQTYPLIIFVHGIGELGDGSPSQLPRLLNGGMAAMINAGEFPNSFTVNGQTHKFIVLSAQFINWPSPADIDGVLNYATSHYRVNTTRVYVTGLSMGGGVTWEYVGSNAARANKIAAIVPFAGASWPDYTRARTIATGNVAVWAFHNNGDGVVPLFYTESYVSQINEAPAPTPQAMKTIFQNGSHDCWTYVYNLNYEENNMNIYEWMLQYQKGTVPPPSPNQLPTSNAGSDQDITLPVTSVQLNGSGTDPDGTIGAYNWVKVSGPAQYTFSNSSIPNPTVSNLTPGTYTFRLRVTDNKGATNYDDMIVSVTAVVPGKIEAEAYTAMSGVQLENNAGASGGVDIGWIDNGDWMDYKVKVNTAGTYTLKMGVGSGMNGGRFDVRKADGTVLATFNVPNTGSYQVFQPVSKTLILGAGIQTLRIISTNTAFWNSDYLDFTLGGTPPNILPIVTAGLDQTILLPANSVNLSGIATDADGTIASYSWSKVSGPAAGSFNNAAIANPSFSGLVQGTYILRLTVTDNNGASSADDVAISVTTPVPGATTFKIEAENWTQMSGVRTENTWDVSGGLDVGWIDNGDWMDYNINPSVAGTYTVNFRIATEMSGAKLEMRTSTGTVLTTVNIPQTGGYQTWQTISATINLTAGQHTIRVASVSAALWNINWMEFIGGSSPPPPPGTSSFTVEAENWLQMNGVRTENTWDISGNLNVGWIDNGDWMEYSINPVTAGAYTISFRVATEMSGARLEMRKSDGTVLTTLNIPQTGGYQTWQTVNVTVTLAAGTQTFRIVSVSAAMWNINWMKFVPGVTAGAQQAGAPETTVAKNNSSLDVFPNPIQDRFMLQVNNDYTGQFRVEIVAMNGAVQKSFMLTKANKGVSQFYLSTANLAKGEYILTIQMKDGKESKKIIKL